MKKTGQNPTAVWKRRITQVMALLFMLYVFAEVSVLQAYCGNESIGIPPAHHFAGQDDPVRDKKESSAEAHLTDTGHPDNDGGQKQSCNDECLGSCTHITVGFFVIEPSLLTFSRDVSNLFSYENKYSNSNLSHLFRPPRNV